MPNEIAASNTKHDTVAPKDHQLQHNSGGKVNLQSVQLEVIELRDTTYLPE